VSVSDDDNAPALASALPSHVAEKRDLLGNFCFYLHFAVMIYFLAGWAVPFRGALIFYLCFVPAVAIQWQFNKDSCVLNNLESYIRTRQWRDPNNKEEGAWLLTLVHNATGILLTALQVNLLTYAILAVLWCAGLSHLLWWWKV
jgi:hypothetical protein